MTPDSFALTLAAAITERSTNMATVARATGVSASTVGRALRGQPIVSDSLWKLMEWAEKGEADSNRIPLQYRDAEGNERTAYLAPEAVLELVKAALWEMGVVTGAQTGPEEWENARGAFEVRGDFITHLDCAFSWHRDHRASNPANEACPVCHPGFPIEQQPAAGRGIDES